uniref:Uncharacterized protein n=1 Tax=Tanacetum cinerariifolium TaxID=118510 RepID=A0A6L2JFC6_TANCI|nr:hypothetical protein [Tanacetum cinerariifolium]
MKNVLCLFWLYTIPQMVINSPYLTNKKELAIPGQTETGKGLSNPLMAGSLPKTTLPTQLTTLKIKIANDDVWLQALIDEKKVVITKASIRHDLKLNDAEGIYVNPSLTKKVFANMKRVGTEFSGAVTPLFDTMMRKHKPRRKEMENKVSPTELHTEDHVPTTSNDPLASSEDRIQLKELMVLCTNLSNKVLDLKNDVIEMKCSHKAKIAELESGVEKLEEENMSLTKELKSFNTKVESLANKETIVDKEESSKQGRKIKNIDADAKVNLENVYNLDMAHEETVLSMQDVTDVDGKEVAEEMVEVIITAKIIVDEVSTAGGTLKATNEELVSVAPTNITTAQTKGVNNITASLKSQVKDKGKAKLVEEPEVLKSRKAHIAINKEVQSRQSDAVRKYQALKRKPVSLAQARKNMMIYLKNMAGFKMEFFKGMSYEDIRPLYEEEYNKVQTLFKEGPKMDAERIKDSRKRTRKEKVEKDQTVKKKEGGELK